MAMRRLSRLIVPKIFGAAPQGAGPQGMVGMGIGGVMAVGLLMAVVMAVVMGMAVPMGVAVPRGMAVVPHGQGQPIGLAGAGAFPLT